jgi:hypothetical protein
MRCIWWVRGGRTGTGLVGKKIARFFITVFSLNYSVKNILKARDSNVFPRLRNQASEGVLQMLPSLHCKFSLRNSICIALRQMPRNACIHRDIGDSRHPKRCTGRRRNQQKFRLEIVWSPGEEVDTTVQVSTWPQCVKLVWVMRVWLSHQVRALPLKHEERFLQSVCGLAFSIVSSDFVKQRQRTKLCTIQ